MEFAEVRPYQPGDDIRSMDWRHTARRGRPFTKLFHEERERPVLVAVDLGPSLQFGTRVAFKSVAAARAAALVAWAAIEAGDRVGGLVWDGARHRDARPAGREAGALGLIRCLVESRPAGAGGQGASLAQPLHALARVARPGTLCIVVSDFHAFDDAAADALVRLARRASIATIQVFDPIEAVAPPPGSYRVADGTREVSVDLNDAATREAWVRPHRERATRLREFAARTGSHHLALATDDDPIMALRALGAMGAAPRGASEAPQSSAAFGSSAHETGHGNTAASGSERRSA